MEQQEKNLVFFTKKKIIFISMALLIFITFVVLMSKFFFNIKFDQIFNTISNSFQKNSNFFLWLFLLFGFPIFNCWWRIWPYHIKLKENNIYVEWYNWLIFCFITFLISSITPFAIGSEPYIIYWMSKKGLTAKEATSIVASVMVFNPFIQVLITWPSFFILSASYNDFKADPKWLTSFWLVFFGLMIDLIGTIFWFAISFSKKFHFLINLIINKIRKILKMQYKSKEEIKEEFIINGSFKKKFVKQIKDYKFVTILIIGSLISNFYYYGLLIISFNFIDPNNNLNPGLLFNYINVATTANNFTPIPGAEGSLQAIILIFINASAQKQNTGITINQIQLKNLLDSSVVIWRTFSFYITTIIGAICFFILISKETYKKRRKNKRLATNFVDKTFSILVPVNDNYQSLKYSLKSIFNNHYDNNKIELILINQNPLIDQKIIDLIQKYQNKKTIKIKFYNNYDPRANWSQMIKDAIKNQWVKHEYLHILDPGSFLNLEIFERLNNIESKNDLFIARFRKINQKNLKTKSILSNQYDYNKIDELILKNKKPLVNKNNADLVKKYQNQNIIKIKHEYLNTLDSDNFLNLKSGKIINPFPFSYFSKKEIKNKNKMFVKNINPFNIFVKTELLTNFEPILNVYQEQLKQYLHFIINQAKTMRIISSLAGSHLFLKQQ